MYKRKLQALEYHQAETYDNNDEIAFRTLMVWLEDQKIRHYKIEDRANLRNIESSDWVKAFDAYLKELNCPYTTSDKQTVADWILGYAVRLDYGDEVDKYKSVTASSVQKSTAAPGTSSNPLDNLDFNDADFKAGIAALSMILQVPPYSDHLEQLKAICLLIKDKLSKENMEKTGNRDQGVFVPLDKTELGFETGDYIINEAAKILRLLHINDLRDLQTRINSAIVGVQALTANPKTDSRLGKVGR